MARFCQNCGTASQEGQSFCANCGAPFASAPPPAPVPVQPVYTPPPAPAGSSGNSGFLKVILIVLGIFMLLAILGIGSCVYVGYRIKKKAEEFTGELKRSDAVRDLKNAAAGISNTPVDPCPELAPDASGSEAKIPLHEGLTLVKAWRLKEGDRETITHVESAGNASVDVVASGPNFNGRHVTGHRSVCREDLKNSRIYVTGFSDTGMPLIHGATMFSMSAETLNNLKTQGSTSLGYMDLDAVRPAGPHSISGISKDGRLTRVEPGDVDLPVIVNDQRVNLPTVHAKGTLGGEATEMYVLDDPLNPLTLRWSMSTNHFEIQVVKISFPRDTQTAAAPAAPAPQIEESLAKTGRAEVYGIYFDFAKADIRDESEPVLKEIADTLEHNPTWKLSVEGHTDNVGGDSYNLDLSNKRAAAVKTALVDRYHISPERLTTEGFGASRPKEGNDTLEGRARNRRVELVRQ